MKIGIDGLGMQSASRNRGIGRYLRHLVEAVAEIGQELTVYASAQLNMDGIPRPHGVHVVPLSGPYQSRIEDVVAGNPQGLDRFVVGSPFELHAGFMPPEPSRSCIPLAAIAYDLIPHIFPADYLDADPTAPRYREGLARLLRYPTLLAISESTAFDFSTAGVHPDRIVVIGAASRPGFFSLGPAKPLPHPLNANRPFVLSLGQHEARKNPRVVIRAFASLPSKVRLGLRLVIVCPSNRVQAATLRQEFRRLCGHDTGLVFFERHVPDDQLRALYRGCVACCLPSRYEGFGLPLLEAMQCGAPIIAGNNSSQPEIAGDAAVLVDADDQAAIGQALLKMVTEREAARELGQRAAERGAKFTWRGVAESFVTALAVDPALAIMPEPTFEPSPLVLEPESACLVEATFPIPASRRDDYDQVVAAGQALAASSGVAICALARNLGNNIAAARAGIETIAALFRHAWVYLYENDSSDGTPAQLASWASEPQTLVRWFKTEKIGHPRWPNARDLPRAQAMADARNAYRDTLTQHVLAGAVAPDYVIVLDTDLAAWSPRGVLHTLGLPGWDAAGSNGLHKLRGLWTQYDAWAWRDRGHPQAHHHTEINPRVFSRADQPIPVISCFGGMAIYRAELFLAARYAGGDCEHVPFHKAIGKLGGKMICNPGMVTLYR